LDFLVCSECRTNFRENGPTKHLTSFRARVAPGDPAHDARLFAGTGDWFAAFGPERVNLQNRLGEPNSLLSGMQRLFALRRGRP
jgi:hypothetical protein